MSHTLSLIISLQIKHFLTLSMHSLQLKLCLHGRTIVFLLFVEQISHSIEVTISEVTSSRDFPLLIGIGEGDEFGELFDFFGKFELIEIGEDETEFEFETDGIECGFEFGFGSTEERITIKLLSKHIDAGLSLF
jgi:hypothetical protein